MPLYVYACACGHEAEHLADIADRDKTRLCPCGKRLKRQMTMPTLHEAYVMKAIMSDGRKIAGRFGREDKRLRKK